MCKRISDDHGMLRGFVESLRLRKRPSASIHRRRPIRPAHDDLKRHTYIRIRLLKAIIPVPRPDHPDSQQKRAKEVMQVMLDPSEHSSVFRPTNV
ncbi:hypothetical protein K474DRAFT_1659952 [Panus rudis PR-1116 ss-1]|nr:hypothetical protein K474DRAFT_1659952 [Panus rudis PR-1116 ss-1]